MRIDIVFYSKGEVERHSVAPAPLGRVTGEEEVRKNIVPVGYGSLRFGELVPPIAAGSEPRMN